MVTAHPEEFVPKFCWWGGYEWTTGHPIETRPKILFFLLLGTPQVELWLNIDLRLSKRWHGASRKGFPLLMVQKSQTTTKTLYINNEINYQPQLVSWSRISGCHQQVYFQPTFSSRVFFHATSRSCGKVLKASPSKTVLEHMAAVHQQFCWCFPAELDDAMITFEMLINSWLEKSRCSFIGNIYIIFICF